MARPNTLVYFSRNGLITVGKKTKAAKLPIGQDLIHHLEMQDPDQFIQRVADFFAKRGLKGKKVLVVLDPSAVFSKQLGLLDKDQAEEKMEDFVAQMPFEPDQRIAVKLESDEGYKIFATNMDLLWCLSQALTQARVGSVVAITPAAAYSLEPGSRPDAAIDQFFSDKSVRKAANFAVRQ